MITKFRGTTPVAEPLQDYLIYKYSAVFAGSSINNIISKPDTYQKLLDGN